MLESQSEQRGSHPFIPGLDALRGLACLAVCLHHACGIKVAHVSLLPQDTWLRILFQGRGAVVLFFVLSGFVLRLSLANQGRKPLPSVSFSFLLGRLFRLFPVVIATTLVIAAVRVFCDGRPISLFDLFRYASLIDVRLVGHFWTMQVEVFGSLLVILAYVVERKIGIIGVVLLTGFLVPCSFLGHSWDSYRPFLYLLYLFTFGYLLAAVPQIPALWARHSRWLMPATIALFYGVAIAGIVFHQWGRLLTAISCSILVGIVSVKRYAILEWRPIRMMGILSFGFYALHWLGLRVATRLAAALVETGLPTNLVITANFICVLAVTIPLALVMHYAVERPGMKVGYHLRQALKRTSPVSNRPAPVQASA